MSTTEEKITFCRICEPLCGMIATVEDGRLTQLRPDREHPLSRGFACPKGIAFTDVHNDPDRVLHPMQRQPDGTFAQVSWEEALDDIASRLGALIKEYGGRSVGWYFGNPAAFSYSHILWMQQFTQLLRTKHVYSAGSQDVNQRFVASELLYGNPITAPVPDLPRTDLLVIVGANPVVSHGSVITIPRIKDELKGVVGRGGRVVVVDPRRTETAAQFEWLPIRPDGDALLLLSLLQVMFAEGLVDRTRLHHQATGADELEALVAGFTPESTEPFHDVPPEAVRDLARALCATERAAVYGRTGTSLGRFATLTTALLDIVNLVAGNVDVPGGAVFGDLGIPGQRLGLIAARTAVLRTGKFRSRIGDLPSVLGTAPAAVMAKEALTAGRGQLRALFVSAGNPVLSVPNGDELEQALGGLDLMVAMDLYINETNAHADYVLPATTMYERDDFPLAFQTNSLTPYRQATRRVVEPAGEAREEWEVLEALMQRLSRVTPSFRARELARRAGSVVGMGFHPRQVVEGLVRVAGGGDKYGLHRKGLTLEKLERDHPRGVKIADSISAGSSLKRTVLHRGGKARLVPTEIAEEVERLRAMPAPDPDYPLLLIGMREQRSENSWMHNSPTLTKGDRQQYAHLHPDDAATAGVAEGELVELSSPHGSISLPATLTDDIKRGVVAVPHGWGHKGTGGWRRANSISGGGGVNVNLLMSSEPEDVEPIAGMAHLNGVRIRATRASVTSQATEPVVSTSSTT